MSESIPAPTRSLHPVWPHGVFACLLAGGILGVCLLAEACATSPESRLNYYRVIAVFLLVCGAGLAVSVTNCQFTELPSFPLARRILVPANAAANGLHSFSLDLPPTPDDRIAWHYGRVLGDAWHADARRLAEQADFVMDPKLGLQPDSIDRRRTAGASRA